MVPEKLTVFVTDFVLMEVTYESLILPNVVIGKFAENFIKNEMSSLLSSRETVRRQFANRAKRSVHQHMSQYALLTAYAGFEKRTLFHIILWKCIVLQKNVSMIFYCFSCG